MKLIHCADLHLDSKLNANLDNEQAKKRRAELLNTFVRMVDYAVIHEVKAILIAGDMFDTKRISATTRNTVLHTIEGNPDITFYYLKGNHDQDSFLAELEKVPENLKLFGEEWTQYDLGKVVISGIELCEKNIAGAYVTLVLDASKVNVVMMHGQEAESSAKDKAEIVNLKELRGKGIDYLALGHIHLPKREKLDSRGIYCYCGCLEGRGFDECGERGFVLLDIDEEAGKIQDTFIPFAERKLHEVPVDVTGANTTAEMIDIVKDALVKGAFDKKDLLKIVLRGALDVECEKDVESLVARFKSQYYFVKAYDETTLKVDIMDYMYDESLKGEFVRMVMNEVSLSEEEKAIVIRYGLQALAGEEVQ
jgi:DNA repair exonuclease SbcCD nuclease subunit